MKFTSRAASLLKGLGALCLAAYLPLTSCKDDVSSIGGSLTSGEVTIVMDSIYTDIQAKPVLSESIDGRSLTKLVGRINVPEYGRLECAFVTQMMSATKMPVPDSITEQHVDSMRLVLSVPRGSLTGNFPYTASQSSSLPEYSRTSIRPDIMIPRRRGRNGAIRCR